MVSSVPSSSLLRNPFQEYATVSNSSLKRVIFSVSSMTKNLFLGLQSEHFIVQAKKVFYCCMAFGAAQIIGIKLYNFENFFTSFFLLWGTRQLGLITGDIIAISIYTTIILLSVKSIKNGMNKLFVQVPENPTTKEAAVGIMLTTAGVMGICSSSILFSFSVYTGVSDLFRFITGSIEEIQKLFQMTKALTEAMIAAAFAGMILIRIRPEDELEYCVLFISFILNAAVPFILESFQVKIRAINLILMNLGTIYLIIKKIPLVKLSIQTNLDRDFFKALFSNYLSNPLITQEQKKAFIEDIGCNIGSNMEIPPKLIVQSFLFMPNLVPKRSCPSFLHPFYDSLQTQYNRFKELPEEERTRFNLLIAPEENVSENYKELHRECLNLCWRLFQDFRQDAPCFRLLQSNVVEKLEQERWFNHFTLSDHRQT